ncbi:L-type lectin-domain containing receptor kinase V.9-like [Cryptomeria japonica]|uniref:L-type lectin-domain containing receptor kinase V.9-like n=1 Tax=Cryptomeria japonica TaxID=3369 RepID=UPI0027DA4DE6|nr:L-type lectin-domain containing receptor kinase V.9-like [Cryptomeria japonica]
MKDRGSLNSISSFSTSFVFSIVASSTSHRGFGMAYLMTPHKSLEGFSSNQYLGLIRNLSSMGKASNHLFAVEFLTLKNLEFYDIDDNHVGVDLNDLRVTIAEAGSQRPETLLIFMKNTSLPKIVEE